MYLQPFLAFTNLTLKYFCNSNYRGVAYVKINKKFNILLNNDIIEEINKYEYFKDYNNYVNLLLNKSSDK